MLKMISNNREREDRLVKQFHPKVLLALTSLLSTFTISTQVMAEEGTEKEDSVALDEVVVKGSADDFSVLPTGSSSGAFGLDMDLSDTPRSVTEVSSELVKNYGLRSVDDLVRLTPGAFTSSFFGIKGAMDIRGEPADNFYRGFRRISNPGAFNTNIRGAQTLEILRGPVSPVYGTGSVGGQLNYIPKSAKNDTAKYIEKPTGRLDVTLGTYNQKVISGELGLPFELAGKQGGVYAFAEVEDSDSYYHGYHPSNEQFQVAVNYDLSDKHALEFGMQYQTSDSIQVPGWTRVTQDLIDNGTYVTGAGPDLNSDNPIGSDRLLPQESGFITPFAPAGLNSSFSGVGSFCIPSAADSSNYTYNGFNLLCLGPGAIALQEETVGTTTIDHRTTFIDDIDFAETTAMTAYLDFITYFDNGVVWKNQAFYDYLDHNKFQSWGFTALYPDANILELRSSVEFEFESGDLFAKNVAGVSWRKEDLDLNHAFFDETFDFRDMTVGPTPDDRIDWAVEDPYENATIVYDDEGNPVGIDGTVRRNFNEEQVSVSKNLGVFWLSNIEYEKVNLLLGARVDKFDVEAREEARSLLGILFIDEDGDNKPDTKEGSETKFSWNMSLSYDFDNGLLPYVTIAESNSLSTNQLGGIIPGTIDDGSFVQGSDLFEAGLKYANTGGTFYSALSYFDQEKSFRDSQSGALVAVYSEGIELEVRAALTDRISLAATATHIETTEVSDGAFTVINGADFAAQNGLEPWQVYGGRIAGARSTFVGEGVELDRGGLPDNIVSLYGNYAHPLESGQLRASLGFTWADSTYTDIMQSVKLPSYSVWTTSVGYVSESFELLAAVNNLFDEKYYTSADLFDSVVVKPSEGRTASITATYKF